ncbi:hypothetical protein Vretifemale_7248, partial [Volvox reticuliferus]
PPSVPTLYYRDHISGATKTHIHTHTHTHTHGGKVPELSPFLLWVIAGIPLATTTILILAIDLGTDMVPAISFAYETREADIMSRKPRNALTDHLVDLRLLLFTYLHIGVMQALAGWFGYFVCMNDYGYAPWVMHTIGFSWNTAPLLCYVGNDGKVSECGFGCKSPNADIAGAVAAAAGLNATDIAAMRAATTSFCKDGCFAKNSYGDPFSEFAPGGRGFRGFAVSSEAVCGRTCSWYNSLSVSDRAFYLSESASSTSLYRNILTTEDDSSVTSNSSAAASSMRRCPPPLVLKDANLSIRGRKLPLDPCTTGGRPTKTYPI